MGPGSPTRFYPVFKLPSAELQAKIILGCVEETYNLLLREALGYGMKTLPTAVTVAFDTRKREAERMLENSRPPEMVPIPAKLLDKKEEAIALARADLIKHYLRYAAQAKQCGKVRAKQRFVDEYNKGSLYPKLFELIGPTSYQSIERWRLQYKRNHNDFYAIARQYPKKRNKRITEAERKCLENRILSHHSELITEIIKDAKLDMIEQGVELTVSDATYRRYIDKWKETNFDKWTMAREGEKAYRDKCGWYVDRTGFGVGDVIVADGHTLNFEIINPQTGKPARMTLIVWFDMASSFPVGWVIMPTENTDAIRLALRMAIIVLGKMPKIAYMDNGKAFRGTYFKGVTDDLRPQYSGIFQKLGIDWIYARKHNARAKVVERFFGYLAEFERKAPTYVGTSINTKPAHMRRGETLHKKLHQQVTGGRYPRLEDVYVALARWIETYINQPQPRGRLGDKTPVQAFKEGKGPGVDIHKLTLLMLRSKPTKANRCEVSLTMNGERITYQSEKLHGLSCRVEVLYDPFFPESVLVYDEAGDLICEAFAKTPVHAAAAILGDESDQARFKEEMGIQRRLEKETRQAVVDQYEENIIPLLQGNQQRLGFGGGVVVSLEEERTRKKKELALETKGARYASSSVDMESIIESEPPAGEIEKKEPFFDHDYQRYEYLQDELKERDLSESELVFMAQFKKTNDYKMLYQSKEVG